MSSFLEGIEERYKYGLAILNELANKSPEEIKSILKEICSGKVDEELFDKGSLSKKWEEKENWTNIQIYYYNHVSVDWSGIIFHPEHRPAEQIVKFNKFFKLS